MPVQHNMYNILYAKINRIFQIFKQRIPVNINFTTCNQRYLEDYQKYTIGNIAKY